MAREIRRAATRHASSFGAPTLFNEGERKLEAASGSTPRFANTRAQRRSTRATRASFETSPASGSRSCHLAKQVLPANEIRVSVASLYKRAQRHLLSKGRAVGLEKLYLEKLYCRRARARKV